MEVIQLKKWLLLLLSVMLILLLGAWVKGNITVEGKNEANHELEGKEEKQKKDQDVQSEINEVVTSKVPAKPRRKGINPFGDKKEENTETKETKIV